MFTKVAIAAVLLFASCVALSQSREGGAIEQADANKDGKVTRRNTSMHAPRNSREWIGMATASSTTPTRASAPINRKSASA